MEQTHSQWVQLWDPPHGMEWHMNTHTHNTVWCSKNINIKHVR